MRLLDVPVLRRVETAETELRTGVDQQRKNVGRDAQRNPDTVQSLVFEYAIAHAALWKGFGSEDGVLIRQRGLSPLIFVGLQAPCTT